MSALELSGDERRGVEGARAGLSLDELVVSLERVGARLSGNGRVRATGLHQDSRRVCRGDVFAARSGAKTAGARYIAQAAERGAVALLVERGTELTSAALPVIEVDDVRLAIALAAEAVYGFPSHELGVVGITGTNGKTTSTWLAAQAMSHAGARAARLGTLGYAFENESVDGSLTTPEADDVSRYLARARQGGATHFVMEVSSHALTQARVDAVKFAVAAFTNLTQDHLDYHESMGAYGAAKERLFTDLLPGVAVVNVDDPFGDGLAARCPGEVLRVGKNSNADVTPLASVLDARGIQAQIRVPGAVVELSSRLVGAHNLDNLLMALGIAVALGFDPERAARALGRVSAVPGRLERCDVPVDDVMVLVDYAHTPDALSRALAAARSLTPGRVQCVFGCGGDRDPGKRSQMGEIAARLADRVLITNDNPRSEAPEDIAHAIEWGVQKHPTPYLIELDRAYAIERAVWEAEPGDVVLVAGKGHEPYQIVGSDVHRFDDRIEARRALALRRERLGR